MTLLVVGALHLDVVVRAPHLPAVDETVTGSAVDYVFGGKGGNQAVAAARLGAKVAFAGRVGSDGFGNVIRATLEQNNIDLRQLQTDTGPSGMSAAIVDDQGDYGAVIVSASNLNIDPGQITIPHGTRLVLLQNEVPQAVNEAILKKARAAGSEIWMNAAPARELPHDLLSALDLLIVNRVEAAFYTDLPPDLPVLQTLGKDGVEWQGQRFPAPQITPVSTHGAGDMFVGTLAAARLSGEQMENAISFAQYAAALHVASDKTAREGMSKAAVEDFRAAQSNR